MAGGSGQVAGKPRPAPSPVPLPSASATCHLPPATFSPMLQSFLLVTSTALCVGTLAYVAARAALNEDAGKLRNRLRGSAWSLSNAPKKADRPSPLRRLAAWAARPFTTTDAEKRLGVRRDLARAGIYAAGAPKALDGARFGLMVAGVVLGYLAGNAAGQPMLGLALGGLGGYLSPRLWLRSRIKANQLALSHGLPDCLDLMVVCVEAGLTIDAAMQRVGEELHIAHPAISREVGIAHMETRIGVPRGEALKNLGVRTGNLPLQGLAAMLVQADRFGTSIGHALRVHAESIRQARHHVAEETAAKASVKMSFPLVLFIFPATFIVLAGPTVLNVMGSDLLK